MLPTYPLSLAASRTLEELACQFRSRQRSGEAVYSICSREYLAGKIKRKVSTVSRATTELAELGIIQKEQRRPTGRFKQKYETCIYKPTEKFWAILRRFFHYLRGPQLRHKKVLKVQEVQKEQNQDQNVGELMKQFLAERAKSDKRLD